MVSCITLTNTGITVIITGIMVTITVVMEITGIIMVAMATTIIIATELYTVYNSLI